MGMCKKLTEKLVKIILLLKIYFSNKKNKEI